MKRVLFAVALLLLIQAIGRCKDQPLQLTIKSDKQVYEVGEDIKIYLSLINKGSDHVMVVNPALIVLPEFVGVSGITFGIELRTEKGLILNFPLSTERNMKIVSALTINKEDFTVLKPNETMTKEIVLNKFLGQSNEEYKISRREKISIKGCYHGKDVYTFYKKGQRRQEHINAWTGTLTSNTIIIEVVERKK